MLVKSLVVAALAGAFALAAPSAQAAGGHGGGGGFHGGGGGFHGGGGWGGGGGGWGWGGRSSVFIGGYGFSPYYGYGYGYNPYYYAPPVVYAPPAVTYAPAPVASAPAAAYDQSYCREYQTTVVVDGVSQPTSGVACRQPNGTWRIVQ